MDIIKEAKTEEEVLAVVSRDVQIDDILQDIKDKGDHCVDHLCGCD